MTRLTSLEEVVCCPLLLRSLLSETLAQNVEIKAKAVRTNKSDLGAWRWSLQMSWLSDLGHKSCFPVQIKLLSSFTQQSQTSICIGAGEGSLTKDPHDQV